MNRAHDTSSCEFMLRLHVARPTSVKRASRSNACGSCRSRASSPTTRRLPPMAYDEALAERVRDLLAAARGDLSERKMFSGIAFMIAGNMACAVTSRGLMVRLDPEDAERALAEPHVRPDGDERAPARGWILVAPEGARPTTRRSPAGSTPAPTSPPRCRRSSAMADGPPSPWWRDAVVYQIYPRSFQDSDGDGVGDLAGIASRLDYLEWLGVDAVWLSPIYPSPGADGGYDVSDYTAVDPLSRHARRLRRPDRRLPPARDPGARSTWSSRTPRSSTPGFASIPTGTCGPTATGRRTTGSPPSAVPPGAATEPTGRWYLHSFYPEQPDLDWRNPEVREAVAAVVRFWRERGVDGFRLDAIERAMKDRELRDDPAATGPPALPVPSYLAGDRPGALAQRPRDRRRARRRCARPPPATRCWSARSICRPPSSGAVPRAPRPRVRLRVPALALGPGAAALGDRRGGDARRGRLGALQPRLPAPCDQARRAQPRGPRRCCC